MNSLKYYGLEDDDWVYVHSEICSVAETLGNLETGFQIRDRLWELSASYYNQWRFVLDSYKRLHDIFLELNRKNKEWSSDRPLSQYGAFLLKCEPEIKNYSYLFIISLKALFDLLVCIIDLIQNRQIRKGYKLPDFFNYYKGGKSGEIKFDIPALKNCLDSIRFENGWISNLKLVRDRIIHRGYLLKPDIGYSKIESLKIKTYKGTDFYSDTIEVDIGDILENFLHDIRNFERDISNILLFNMADLKKSGLTHRSRFRFSELMNEYSSEMI